MQRKIYLSFILLLFATIASYGQAGTGGIQGKVLDEAKKEGVPFANVVILRDGVQKGGTTTDVDGKYKFSALPPGRYDIKVSYVGFNPAELKGILVTSDKSTFVDIKMSSGINLKEIIITDYEVPLISKDETSTGGTVTREEIAALPTRDVNSIAATTAGVFQADEGSALNIRGSRSSSTEYYIDGIRVRGGTNLPNAAIEQTTVITGGIPSQYGDATGGIINITTRGPSNVFFGGAEVLSSAFLLEPYGYHLFAMNFSGPLKMINKGTPQERSILGYFISGEFETQQDSRPSAVGVWMLNDDVYNDIRQNPYRPGLFGTGVNQNAEFVRSTDMTLERVRPNAGQNRISLAGKIDFQPNDAIGLTIGANLDRTYGDVYARANSLFNRDNVGSFLNETYRGYVRFRQNFGRGKDQQTGSIKNAYYSIQFDYTKTKSTQDGGGNLGNDPFNYGYIGKYDYDVIEVFSNGPQPVIINDINGNPIEYQLIEQIGFGDVNLRFTPGTVDPNLANYGTSFFNTLNLVEFNNLTQVRSFGGLTNGLRPGTVYGIWNAPGRQNAGYAFSDNDAYRLTALGSADIGGHSLKFGFEFDQRIDRGYNMNPFAGGIGLWGLARSLTNQHILDLDLTNPIIEIDPGTGIPLGDTVRYNRLIASNQSVFDRNLRAKLGAGDREFIKIDALDPSQLDLSFFSATELLNEGNSYVNYFGYDYLGNKLKNAPGQEDFFTDAQNRPVAAFTPIYMAGFIEDKFDFDDLVFRVGVRVDRFDANQPVLKDPFLLYNSRTVGEVDGALNTAGNHPTTMGDDYVVYVNDVNLPTPTILGYRNGNQWYNAEGTEIRNASGIAAASSSGRVQPYLVDPGQFEVRADAFTDYTPQINIMPRIAFSFPISDEAQFFAHYDVLTQRPSGFLRFDPRQYYYLAQVGGTINNPNLKPERTIDYQIGFKQKVNRTSAITISGFYRELRNMIQIINVPFAYPVDYTTFGNIDFGTVKGLTLAYDLRRTGNIRINASYTLQFADGTGSAPQQAANIIQAGIDNLRTPIPLDFDARHRVVGTLDFRFGEGKEYNGPRLGDLGILQGVGFNLVANAISGTPFSRQIFVTPDGDVSQGLTGRTTLKGGINGSRLPWQFRMNLRIDKDFNFAYGRDKNDKPKTSTVNVYIQILNLLDARNVINVYQFTGDPDDDGFLSSDLGAQQLQAALDRQSFIDLYRASMMDPNNYSLPRRTRLGIRLNF